MTEDFRGPAKVPKGFRSFTQDHDVCVCVCVSRSQGVYSSIWLRIYVYFPLLVLKGIPSLLDICLFFPLGQNANGGMCSSPIPQTGKGGGAKLGGEPGSQGGQGLQGKGTVLSSFDGALLGCWDTCFPFLLIVVEWLKSKSTWLLKNSVLLLPFQRQPSLRQAGLLACPVCQLGMCEKSFHHFMVLAASTDNLGKSMAYRVSVLAGKSWRHVSESF